MTKAEPRTILHFIWQYFDVIRDLFETQSNDGIIRKETLKIILDKHKKDIQYQLVEYKIIRSSNEDFELRDTFYKLVEFVIFEFRPLLPEEIEKFGNSISELFRKIQEGINADKNILLERIKALSLQIKEFAESIEKNSIRLLSESRDLKANINKLDYKDKIQKASFWIEYYIVPLNKILDINHSQSISNKLFDISEYANQRQLNSNDEGIRLAFLKLYNLLKQTNDELLKQSKTLINDLLPLIERIKTENLILSGWIEFLKNPYKSNPPKLIRSEINKPYSNHIYYNTKEYFEQFKNVAEAIIDQDDEETNRWVFNKTYYKNLLKESLPIENFYEWCNASINNDGNQISNQQIFALTTLLFEDDIEITYLDNHNQHFNILTNKSKLTLPKLKIS